MKKIFLAIIIIVFIFLAGVYRNTSVSQANNQELQTGNVSMATPFRLLLVVMDKHQSSDLELLTIWQIIIHQQINEINLTPVYPTNDVDMNLEISSSLNVPVNNNLEKDFSKILSRYDIHWDHFLLIDSDGLADLIAITTYENIGSSVIETNLLRQHLAQYANDPDSAYHIQRSLFQQVCLSTLTGDYSDYRATIDNLNKLQSNLYQKRESINRDPYFHGKFSLSCKFDSPYP